MKHSRKNLTNQKIKLIFFFNLYKVLLVPMHDPDR
jgi:hypothetical protein